MGADYPVILGDLGIFIALSLLARQPLAGSRRPGDGQRAAAAGELTVKDQERQPAKVVAVQVGDEHGGDLAGI